jgi:hypothetical protein
VRFGLRTAFLAAHTFRSLSCTHTVVIVSGHSYYRCGYNWYDQVYYQGQVTYVHVAPPTTTVVIVNPTSQQYTVQTTQQALESGKTGSSSTWRNPDNGDSGTFTPTRTYQQEDGRQCREYQQTVTIGGKQEQAYGTACRQPDGSWQIVEE